MKKIFLITFILVIISFIYIQIKKSDKFSIEDNYIKYEDKFDYIKNEKEDIKLNNIINKQDNKDIKEDIEENIKKDSQKNSQFKSQFYKLQMIGKDCLNTKYGILVIKDMDKKNEEDTNEICKGKEYCNAKSSGIPISLIYNNNIDPLFLNIDFTGTYRNINKYFSVKTFYLLDKKHINKYKQICINKLKNIYSKQEKIKKKKEETKNILSQYPEKCEKNNLESEECILIYGFTNGCNLIKKWENIYERCIRLKQLKEDINFINERRYKSFKDFISKSTDF